LAYLQYIVNFFSAKKENNNKKTAGTSNNDHNWNIFGLLIYFISEWNKELAKRL